MKYKINNVFFSIQCEGAQAGTPMVFVRFTGCNMRCDLAPAPQSPGGFMCDTEFESGELVELDEIHRMVFEACWQGDSCRCNWIICTGGEPALQVDDAFIDFFHEKGFKIAIETNGTKQLSGKFDWITVSPKVAEHCLKQLNADEVKYVRSANQSIPKTRVEATHKYLSPAFHGGTLPEENIKNCVDLVKKHPDWKLCVQYQNFLNLE